jgi:hypothetical protein
MLDPKEIDRLRQGPKKVRFCPSCGSRRIKPHALHYLCQVCQFTFSAYPADSIRSIRGREYTKGDPAFELLVIVTVPKGRPGVEELMQSSTKKASRFSSIETG